MGRSFKQTFLQRRQTDCPQNMKRCLVSLTIRKTQSKVKSDITSQQSEWPSTKKNLQTINASKGVEKRGSTCTLSGSVH